MRRLAPLAVALAMTVVFFHRAEVDGRPAPILPANYAVRGVPLRAGAHTVVFAYRTPGLVYGAWTSAVALGLALVVTALGENWFRARYVWSTSRDVVHLARGPFSARRGPVRVPEDWGTFSARRPGDSPA